MPLRDPKFTLTWYPGVYPSDTGPVVLQSADHYVDGAAGFGAAVEDLVQTVEYLRGNAPKFFNRGNRRTPLEWEEVRRYTSPAEAMAAGLDILAAKPSEEGWLRIDLPDLFRSWKAEPCMIQRVAFPQPERDGRATLLRVRWTLLIGPIEEIPGDFEAAEFCLDEAGWPELDEAGFYELAESSACTLFTDTNMASKKTSQRPQITSLATGDRIKAIDVSEPDATKDAWFTIATLTTYLQTLLMANPMTTAGDVITGGSGGTPARLGIGANGRVLGVSGGALAYLDLSGVYEAARTLMSQATAEGGSDTAVFSVNALRLRQAANAAIAAWVGAAPAALDTLDELAAALGDDANFAATVTTALAGKQPLDATLTALAGLTVAADKLIYAVGADDFLTTDFPAFARTLVGAANAGAAARALREAATVITYNTTITPNCNDGLHRVCTMTGNLIVNAPTNGADGMVWRGRFVASGGARELTFHSSVKAPYGSTYEATVESGATRVIHLEHDGSRWMIVRNLEFAP